MIQRPPGVGAFQFVVLAALRAAQLIRGCRPRVAGTHKVIVTAQVEVAEGKVMQVFSSPAALGESGGARFEDAEIVFQQT